ncbi:SDR family oxidoreductase [Hymenobacter properus]|uniref:SDR family oxidoreductase n=1 Tax=Hymenobacter properus TaxID=2791026 RepID=A0A931BGU9_9BACT|nr:SDR family oxidoreductase [Hymenobacter properus]MBF9142206.1 SDR family oxidoreductase [Hymenobacter properus]MBR7721013.1 SDR family oxidoreductase [Microvirga sp. SRT04]
MRVFITGANRGLGLELTRQYLERGDQVFAASRQPTQATELQQLKQQYADRLVLLPLDVASADSIAAAVQAVQANTDALDVLINNAGVYPHAGSGDAHQRLGQLTHDDAIETLQVNAVGPLLVAQALLPLLRAGQRGRILSISSGQGSLTWKATGDPYHYSASKAALNMYMRSLAAEVGHMGLISVLVDPGWMRTDMGGDHATQEPADSARGIIRLAEQLHADENGSFLTWQGQHVPW